VQQLKCSFPRLDFIYEMSRTALVSLTVVYWTRVLRQKLWVKELFEAPEALLFFGVF